MTPSAPVDLDAAFAALADSTRRAVIRELLRGPLRAGELSERVEMSPPALSRHLRVLREAGLIVEDGVEHDARVSVYKLHLDAFAPARRWLDQVEEHWHEQLASFKAYAEGSRGASGERQGRDARRARRAPASGGGGAGSAAPRIRKPGRRGES
jgi:DNA-binding transcriptional ArsR family regulator